MGFFGCFSAPIFNLLIAFSVNVIITFTKRGFSPFQTRFSFELLATPDKTYFTILFILLFSFFHTIMFAIIFKFSQYKLKKQLNWYLIIAYFLYLLGVIAIEILIK